MICCRRLAPVVIVFAVLPAASIPATAATPNSAGTEEVRRQVREGDSAVVPVLERWLADESPKRPLGKGSPKLLLAIWGAGEFGLDSTVATLMDLYRDPTADASLKGRAVTAAARIGTPSTRSLLWAGMNDMKLPWPARFEAGGTLVAMGDVSARNFLGFGYQEYLSHLNAPGNPYTAVRAVLERASDQQLMDRFESMKARQTEQVARNSITTLVEIMKINAMDVEDLFPLAEETNWLRGMSQRYYAIAALGRKGTPEILPRLEKLRPWADGDVGGANPIQQNFVQEYRDAAIGAILRRAWQQHPAPTARRPIPTRAAAPPAGVAAKTSTTRPTLTDIDTPAPPSLDQLKPDLGCERQ